MELFRSGAFTNKVTEETNYYIDYFLDSWVRLSGYDNKEKFDSVVSQIENEGGVFVQHIVHIKEEDK
jgi:hypothetical protein